MRTMSFAMMFLRLVLPGPQPLWKRETLSIVVAGDGFTRIDPAGRKVSVASAWSDLERYRDLLVDRLTRKTVLGANR